MRRTTFWAASLAAVLGRGIAAEAAHPNQIRTALTIPWVLAPCGWSPSCVIGDVRAHFVARLSSNGTAAVDADFDLRQDNRSPFNCRHIEPCSRGIRIRSGVSASTTAVIGSPTTAGGAFEVEWIGWTGNPRYGNFSCTFVIAPSGVASIQSTTTYLPLPPSGDGGAVCYANCDSSTSAPVLNVNDFTCFLDRYAAADPYANCDGSTVPPTLSILDLTCFLNAFAAGCH